ncbi:MAG: hypothetical protein JO368_05125 [Acidimicrobiales bacterium]|nr:hypothetical protein [Acidimicrobiales bacterium]
MLPRSVPATPAGDPSVADGVVAAEGYHPADGGAGVDGTAPRGSPEGATARGL